MSPRGCRKLDSAAVQPQDGESDKDGEPYWSEHDSPGLMKQPGLILSLYHQMPFYRVRDAFVLIFSDIDTCTRRPQTANI
jgi:hypothetical protein